MSVNRTLLAVVYLAAATAAALRAQAVEPDAVCGPRCAHWLLERYGKDAPPLTDLIVEMQETVSAGSTFAAVRDALTKRGVDCALVPLDNFDLLTWPEPVIVHLDGGHFAVAVSRSGTMVRMWDGLAGERDVFWPALRRRMSGVVMLTSERPITAGATYRTTAPRWCATVVGVTITLSGMYLVRRSLKSRTKGHSVRHGDDSKRLAT